MLPSTDPERLSDKESWSRDSTVRLGRGNGIDFVGGLGPNQGGNRRDQAWAREESSGGREYWER